MYALHVGHVLYEKLYKRQSNKLHCQQHKGDLLLDCEALLVYVIVRKDRPKKYAYKIN